MAEKKKIAVQFASRCRQAGKGEKSRILGEYLALSGAKAANTLSSSSTASEKLSSEPWTARPSPSRSSKKAGETDLPALL
jgi:hypothetical protein